MDTGGVNGPRNQTTTSFLCWVKVSGTGAMVILEYNVTTTFLGTEDDPLNFPAAPTPWRPCAKPAKGWEAGSGPAWPTTRSQPSVKYFGPSAPGAIGVRAVGGVCQIGNVGGGRSYVEELGIWSRYRHANFTAYYSNVSTYFGGF